AQARAGVLSHRVRARRRGAPRGGVPRRPRHQPQACPRARHAHDQGRRAGAGDRGPRGAARAPLSYGRLTASPPFITNTGRSSTVTSLSGSPLTPTRSPWPPTLTWPTSATWPSARAAVTVADWIAWSRVAPHFTIVASCLALLPCGYTPASVE